MRLAGEDAGCRRQENEGQIRAVEESSTVARDTVRLQEPVQGWVDLYVLRRTARAQGPQAERAFYAPVLLVMFLGHLSRAF